MGHAVGTQKKMRRKAGTNLVYASGQCNQWTENNWVAFIYYLISYLFRQDIKILNVHPHTHKYQVLELIRLLLAPKQ